MMSAEEEIRRILALGTQKIDDRDVDGYVALFSTDAKLITRTEQYQGREVIRSLIATAFGSWPTGSFTKHLIGGSVITVRDTTAEALTDLVVFQSLAEGGWHILQAGRYEDLFVLENGIWHISQRRVLADVFHRSSYRNA